MQNDAQIEMRLGEFSVGGDGALIGRLRLGQLPGLVQGHAVLERLGGFYHLAPLGILGQRLFRQLTLSTSFLAGRCVGHGLA